MRNTFDIVDILYEVLSTDTEVTGAIAGKVYKHNRPTGSEVTDIVVNCLPINNETLQQTVANVNIHVPNIGSNADRFLPDTKKLKSLTALLIRKLDEQEFGEYFFEVQQQNVLAEPEAHEHFSNIRLNFYAENFKN